MKVDLFKVVAVLNVVAILLYAPNYIDLIFPSLKYVIPVVTLLTTAFFLCNRRSFFFDSFDAFPIVFFVLLIAICFLNYILLDSSSTLLFGFGMGFRLISVYVFFACCNQVQVKIFLRYFIVGVSILAMHTICQFFLFALGVIESGGYIETQGYKFYLLGVFGLYRVGVELNGIPILRAQSFFQEPGFLAFYFVFSLSILFALLKSGVLLFGRRASSFLYALFSFATILTLSFTGMVCLMILFFFYIRSTLLKVSILMVSAFMLSMVLLSGNEYLSKTGSFLLRLEDFFGALRILYHPSFNWLTGIGYNNELSFGYQGKVNNLLIEVLFYGGVPLLLTLVLIFLVSMLVYSGFRLVSLLLGLFMLSTPMGWSPLFMIYLFLLPRITKLKKNIV